MKRLFESTGLISPSWNNRIALLSAGFLGAQLFCVPAAIGQEEAEQEQAKTLQTIVVTGSNIRSRSQDFVSTSPLQTVGQQEIENTGAVRVQDIFKGISANSGSQIANRQNALQGLSQFSLRGLGIGSTLTLINGRRAGLAPITDSSGQLFTDSNQYPVNMIERVEILTDGASSTYGSEAVAGVVNIFTRNNFEGLEFTGELRSTTNESAQFGVAAGSSFDRGHIAVFANAYVQSGNTRKDFDVIADGNRLEDGPSGAFDSSTGSPGRFNLAVPDPNNAGSFLRSGNTLADPDCVEAGGMLDGNNCRYHFLNQYRIIPEEERVQVFAVTNYEATEKLNFFGEFGFSRNEIRDGVGGQLTRVTTQDGGFLVPSDHPFNFFVSDGAGGISYAGPEAFSTDPSLQAVDLIYRGRILGADGDGDDNYEEAETIFTNTRLLGGFDYDIGETWLLNSSLVWSQSDFARRYPRDWDIPVFAAQIEAGNWNPFGTRLVDPGLVSPKDGVSVAANSDDVYREIALIRADDATVTQRVAEVILSGELPIELPGGSVATAFGAQYRDLDLVDIPDGRYQAGLNRLNETIPVTEGEQSAYAFFGEIALPILDNLEIQTALRYEDYGDQGGDTLDPKISGRWDITDNFAFRGSWGSSFQAPSIRQISGVISNAAIVDPADPAAGNFNITVITQGSDSLTPQSADNLNLGLIFSKDSLNVSVDYWTYDYEGLILPGADPQFIFNEVFAGRLPADRATREATGQPATVVAEFENRGTATATGFDVNARYAFDVGSGDIALDAQATYITEYESSEFGDILSNRNFSNGFGSTPDLKANAGATWTLDSHSANVTARYISSYDDDQNATTVDAQTTFDLRYSYDFDSLLGSQGTTLGIGVTNVFDEAPPRLASRPFFDTEVHDVRGRQIFLNVKHTY